MAHKPWAKNLPDLLNHKPIIYSSDFFFSHPFTIYSIAWLFSILLFIIIIIIYFLFFWKLSSGRIFGIDPPERRGGAEASTSGEVTRWVVRMRHDPCSTASPTRPPKLGRGLLTSHWFNTPVLHLRMISSHAPHWSRAATENAPPTRNT